MVYYCDPLDNLGVIDKFFFIFGIISSGLVFSFLTTSYYCYLNKKDDSECEEEENNLEVSVDETKEVIEKKYEDLYPIKEATNTYTNKVEVGMCVTIENTPDGIVLMKYDFDNET